MCIDIPTHLSAIDKNILEEMGNLLPDVVPILKESGRLDDWMNFMRNLSKGNFPSDNIAFQLFMDVSRWYATDNTCGMRYSKHVKRFWAVGYKLFHERFLRYMGGFKNTGDVMSGHKRGCLQATNSRVNFVTPGVNTLRDLWKKHADDCEKPCIITNNICMVADKGNETTSYKLCIDGKKISSGFGQKLGDVDLFDHEGEPTLRARKERLENELLLVSRSREMLSDMPRRNGFMSDIRQYRTSNTFKEQCKQLMETMSIRLKELRQAKQKKVTVLENLRKNVAFKEAKLVYAISGVQTMIYRLNDCISKLLHAIDGIGFGVSTLNGTEDAYCRELQLEFKSQCNYNCLLEINDDVLDFENNPDALLIYSALIKQRSENWFEIRRKACVTGSRLNTALGLSGLKRQNEYIDMKINGKEEPVPSQQVKDAMEHGTKNEINALATLLGKVLPVINPQLEYYEDGCRILIQDGKVILGSSADGYGKPSTSSHITHAFEFKCPTPNKMYTTDLHYKIPSYYIPQLLAEMRTLGCTKLLYLCYTQDASTVFEVTWNQELWDLMWQRIVEIFAVDTVTKQKRAVSHLVKQLTKQIDDFIENQTRFVGEFPSVRGKPCSHGSQTNSGVYIGEHQADVNTGNEHISVNDMDEMLYQAESCIKEAYQLCRLPAKEVVIALISDMDRVKTSDAPHATPVAYGLSGYSLKTESIRSLLFEIIRKCADSGLHVPVLSFDGQFYKLAVKSADGQPLTILQLQKAVWDKTRKMRKDVLISTIMGQNRVLPCENITELSEMVSLDYKVKPSGLSLKFEGPVYVGKILDADKQPYLYIPTCMTKWMNRKFRGQNCDKIVHHDTHDSSDLGQEDDDPDNVESLILSNLPVDVIEQLDEMTMQKIKAIECEMSKQGQHNYNGDIASQLNDDMMIDFPNVSEGESELATDIPDLQTHKFVVYGIHMTDVSNMVIQLKNTNDKWNTLTESVLLKHLTSAQVIMNKFTRDELLICLRSVSKTLKSAGVEHTMSMPKYILANIFAKVFGDDSFVSSGRKRSPSTLRGILKDFFTRKMLKVGLDVIVASNTFHMHDLPDWRRKALFRDGTIVGDAPYVWYSQPEYVPDLHEYVYTCLDCHHLFVNARCTVCARGIPGYQISNEAWLHVARECKTNRTGLNLAMVVDLIDRQSNSFAQRTFSKQVELEMLNTHPNESELCRVLREWYEAEDGAGLEAQDRVMRRMRMREWLLRKVNLGTFPPPGSHVNTIPIVMFEGILTNIDRKIQLHSAVKSEGYNVRSVSSLDSETFFGSFQDLDPKGSGVLMPDDIPKAIETASYLAEAHLDDERYY